MENIAIKINYKRSGVSKRNDYHISELINNLKEHYIVNPRSNGGPKAGGLLDTVIEIIFNIPLEDFVKLIRDGVVFDTITRGKDSYLLKTLFQSFAKIEQDTIHWDYSHISFLFDDTVVNIYGTDNMFTSKIGHVLNAISKNYTNLIDEKLGLPYEIHIPIVKVISEGGNIIFENQEPLLDYNLETMLSYWGVSYELGWNKRVFDLNQSILLNENWEMSY